MPADSCMSRRTWRCLGALLVLASFFPALASAQYFGRNRVRYEKFDWQILRTDHFDVYYYPEEEQGVRDAARMAERWYQRLSSVFGRGFAERKSIILYADQSDFQQTTLSRGAIGEGTGGFTEALRTRVVMPLTGNYEDTDHVLGHELVHVFQYDILQQPTPGGGRRSGAGGINLPLWFIEGLAEYLSLGREYPQSAMWLRDALIRDELPDLRRLSRNPRYFPYRWGHAFWAYVGGRWGDQVVGQLFVAGTQIGIEEALNQILGVTSEEFSTAWQASIREAYAPVLAERLAPGSTGQRILPQRESEEQNPNYIAPVISPRGDEVMLFSTRGLFSFDLYLADARTGEIRERVVSENADPHLDSLRFLDSAGSWSPDGNRFAFVVAARGDNELAIVDVRSRRIERRIPIEGVGQMWNTSWSPDGRSIAFAGSVGGITDLFVHDLESGHTRRLTNDTFADLQPEWSPDGRTLAFVSDRGRGTNIAELTYGPMGIWLLDVGAGGAAGEPRQA
ncbi:MAG TPA: peptidase S9, partial [Thermoanaerobaculia bacterium]|nr:peptidase S9 [Thermoanaerobaculia bacterium]